MFTNLFYLFSTSISLLMLPAAFLTGCCLLMFSQLRNEKFFCNFTLAILSIGFANSLLQICFNIFFAYPLPNSSIANGITFRNDKLLICSLCYLLTYVTAIFSRQYLHKERGFPRFYLFLLIFCYGMCISAGSQSLTGIYIGWELVGLTSFLLISFFYQREKSVHRSLRIYAWYKFADFFLLLGIACTYGLNAGYSLAAELCLCIAVLIKSAQFPFSYWLLWALEGPSPSSAVFYGGLGIHLGALALLTYITGHDLSSISVSLLLIIPLITIAIARLTQISQSDAKSLIVYGTISQVSIILIEIALGCYTLALLHIIGHAILRTYQILRVGGIIHDHPASTWRSLITFTDCGVFDGARTSRLRNLMFGESTKEVNFVHTPIILLDRIINSINCALKLSNKQVSISKVVDSLFYLTITVCFAVYCAHAARFLGPGYLEYSSYALILISIYFSFSKTGISEIPRSLFLFQLGLFSLQSSETVRQYETRLVTVEFFAVLVAFSGLLLARYYLQKRFGRDYVDHHSGLISVCPEAGVCIFISTLSMIGFPGTIGYFGEEHTVDHLIIHGPLMIVVPIAFTFLAWSCFRKFCDTFYGRCTVSNIKLFELKIHEKITLNLLSAANILVAIVYSKGFFHA